MKKLLLSVTLFIAWIYAATLTQGCAVGHLAFTPDPAEADAYRVWEAYTSYVNKSIKANAIRKTIDIKPAPIMNYEEWKAAKRPKVFPLLYGLTIEETAALLYKLEKSEKLKD